MRVLQSDLAYIHVNLFSATAYNKVGKGKIVPVLN
jgi:hypothetical protein